LFKIVAWKHWPTWNPSSGAPTAAAFPRRGGNWRDACGSQPQRAMLERNLRVRLFQRSSRSLALTEDGERFLASITDGLDSTQLGPSES